jgi:hypothetical protein
MSEDQGRHGFGGKTLQIDTVPCWDGGREDAWFGTQTWISIVAYAETISIVRPSVVLQNIIIIRASSS